MDGHKAYYKYDPSLPAAAIFTTLFAISTTLHIWQTVRQRSWFLIAFIIGGIFETIGYGARIASSQDKTAQVPFIIQTVFLLLGPVLFAASIYMMLARIIVLTDGQRFALVRPAWITKIFVAGDVLSFLMQAVGAVIFTSADTDANKAKRGENIIVGGLFAQLAFFGFFITAAVVYHIRARAHLNGLPAGLKWKRHLYVLYSTAILILCRSIVRVVEFLEGSSGYIYTHEVFIYVFDGVFMLGVMVIMNVVHPGDIAIMLKQKEEGADFMELGRPVSRNKNPMMEPEA